MQKTNASQGATTFVTLFAAIVFVALSWLQVFSGEAVLKARSGAISTVTDPATVGLLSAMFIGFSALFALIAWKANRWPIKWLMVVILFVALPAITVLIGV